MPPYRPLPAGYRTLSDEQYPADPYPGARPDFSFAHLDGTVTALHPDPAAPSGWRTGAPGTNGAGPDLDHWLARRNAVPLAERVPVLAYGSNVCPGKITWLRDTLGLTGPVVALRARCVDLAAVWAYGIRARDGQRPATLAALPGAVEHHAVWLADPEQVKVLDVCEGRGRRYHLARVGSGRVETEDGTVWDRPLAYVGAGPGRRPMLVAGRPVRCADLDQAGALDLRGRCAPGDGLEVSVVDGRPAPEDHPAGLFVYGTLRPDRNAWPLVRPLTTGEPCRARVRATLYDTGFGYPALRPGGDGEVSGWLLTLRSPARAGLATVDAYEGADYRRVRTSTTEGAPCWTYAWTGDVAGLSRLDTEWPAS